MRISDWSSDVCSSDLAGRDRPHRRLDAGGKLVTERIEALGHLLAVEIDVGGLVENHGNLAEAVARDRARAFEPRNSTTRGFTRDGPPLFHVLRTQARGYRAHLHLLVVGVWHSVSDAA